MILPSYVFTATQKLNYTDNIQFNANQMNKSRAHIEFVEFYMGPAYIHLVCIKLYVEYPNVSDYFLCSVFFV